jgi:solute carrier family 25, member 33/36
MNPVWMIRTRYQILGNSALGQRTYKNYMELVKLIWKEEGPLGFYKGLTASYFGCVEGAVQWITYEQLVRGIKDQKGVVDKKMESLKLFGAAAASKFVAICLTYPHEVVRTRLREQATNGVFKYKGFWQTMALVGKEEGIR